MNRIYVPVMLALSAFAVPTSTLFAQTAEGRFHEGTVDACQARPGGSRIRSNSCEPEEAPQTVRTEHEVSLRVPLPAPSGPPCEVSALTEYSQRNTMARVEGSISIAMCPAGSTGSFTIVARVRDPSGESKLLEFNQTWQRDDTEDHKFNSDFPIGENAELVSVRLRSLDCTCAATTTATATATAASEIIAPEAAPPK
jgi:hypothetical protein